MFQLPPAKGSELKTHPYLLCNGWKQMEKSSHAGISQSKNENTERFHRDSPKVKIFSSRTGPGPQLGIHLAHLQTFPKFDSARAFLRKLGFGTRIWFGSTLTKSHQHVSA